MENKLTTLLNGMDALICGSTSGIGLSCAREFALSGANVTLFSRNKEKLQQAVSMLDSSNNQKHQYLIGDFNFPEEIKKTITLHINSGNKFHILVNNSGGPNGGKIINAKTSEFIETFNRHLICNHILVKSLLPQMIGLNYGRIINIISTSVKEPISGLGVSNTIRAAVASWAKTLSKEIMQDGITINNILPGYTNTERLLSIIESKSQSSNRSIEEISDTLKNQVPLKRFGKPTEIAKAVSFIASPSAAYINGISLAVDGGRINSI